MKILKIKFFIYTYFLCTNCFAQNLTCYDLRPENSEVGYKALDNRCEGYYIPKYSGSLQLVSFTQGNIKYNWSEETVLNVSIVKKVSEPANIRGVSLPRNIHYQMDGFINPEEKNSLRWPIYPFIYNKNKGLTYDKLGVYGWTGSEENKIFIPVSLTEEGDTIDSDTILIKFRPTSNLTHFRWIFFESDINNSCRTDKPITNKMDYEGDMHAGSIIEIALPGSQEFTGQKCMEINYRSRDKSWKSELINLYLSD